MELLAALNPQQLAAVTAGDGQTLVIAGAGSGKTRVLVSRIAWLIAEKKVSPYQIMAVTFTNKAVREIKDRVEQLTGLSVFRMWVGTFHSLCARLLRMESAAFGIANDFTIYDTADSKSLIKQALAQLGLDDDKNYHPAAVAASISDAKNKLIPSHTYLQQAEDEWQQNVGKVYQAYQILLKQNNALDFDDLLTHAVWYLERHPAVLRQYQERFRHILVDEYQDTNHCQYRLIHLLAGGNGNLFAVGDPDQSIYRWRGADISNILDFSQDYPHFQQLQLTQNYRSTQAILDAANALIVHNHSRTPKELFTEAEKGETVVYHQVETDKEEAAYVMNQISLLVDDQYSLQDVVVLYRTHSQSRLFEDVCIRYGIPYRIFGGMKFYDRKEVKDTLAYLRILANSNDGEALSRIYNQPRRGIGKTSWDKLLQAAEQERQSLWQTLAHVGEYDFATAAKTKLSKLYEMLAGLKSFASTESSVAKILQEIWHRTGYLEMILLSEDSSEKIEILEQLTSTAADFDLLYAERTAAQTAEDDPLEPPLLAFLSQVSLATDLDDAEPEQGFLTLMTLHAAKGLEFPVVFMVGMEEGLFPHRRSLFSGDDGEMEEERRLCYVGITRAQQRLFLTAANRRFVWGKEEASKTSRFLDEIPRHLLKCTGIAAYQAKETKIPVGTKKTTSLFQPYVAVPPEKKQAPAQIFVGDKLRHAKFGDGVVVALSGSGEDLQVNVAFPDTGIKKLMWKYAPIKKI